MKFLSKIQAKLSLIKTLSNSEQKNIDRLFTRVFSNDDGQKILAYLHHITTNRVTAPNVSEEQLRHMEGQRALLQTIEKLTARGRNS